MEWERRKLSQSARNRKTLEGGGSKGGGLSVGGRNMQFGEGWTKVLAGRKIGYNKVIQGTGKQRGITSKKNISGPNQTLGQVTESTKRPVNTVSFLMSRGINRITSFGVISAGSAAATKKKKQKKRVGRTILTEY